MNRSLKPHAPTIDTEGAIKFHGHSCPGLGIGIRAAEIALREIGPHSADEEVVAIVETDMCGVDAIQYLTGCTFGKGNLIHLDYGKNAFTFIRRSDGKAIRVVWRPPPGGESRPTPGALAGLEDEERARLARYQRIQEILELPLERLFEVQTVTPRMPALARVRESIRCQVCGEMVMETRARLLGGRQLCLPCFEVDNNR